MVILDITISSPLLRGMIGRKYNREYTTVDEAIKKEDWDAIGFLVRSGAYIVKPTAVYREIGKHGSQSQIQDLIDSGIT